MSDLIERLRDKTRLRAAHGLSGWVLSEEALLSEAADEIERLRAALSATLPVVHAERERLALSDYRSFRIIVTKITELDAIIAQADAALGTERD